MKEFGEPRAAGESIVSMPLVEYALDYARRGWAVFPCKPGNKAPYIPADVDAEGNKIARTGGLYKATRDVDVINDWWQRWPHAMIGVRMGEASGVWGLDPDAPKEPGKPDGTANWAKLCAENGGCPSTHTHLTPGGGKHLLFKWDPDRPVKNESRLDGIGINVRGNGGYVIAPPSQRHDGKAYEIAEALDFFNFAEAPDWLYGMILSKPAREPELSISERAVATVKAAIQSRSNGNRAYAEAALRNEYSAVAGAVIDRNKTLNKAALKLGSLVGAGELSEHEVTDALYDAATACGYVASDGQRATMATIESGLGAGIKQPRQIPERQLRIVAERQPPARALDPKTGEALPLVLSSSQFVAGFTPPEFLIDGIMQRGYLYSLTARTGHGKTAVSMYLSQCIARGLKMHGKVVKKGTVLILAGENPDDIRARYLVLADENNFDVETMPISFIAGVVDIAATMPTIKAAADLIDDLVLVIVDTAAAYFKGDDSNSNTQQGDYARLLRQLTFLPGKPAVLVCCHPIKNAKRENLLPVGGGAFVNEVDGNLTLWANADKQTTLHWLGKFRGPEFEPLTFEMSTVESARVVDADGRCMPSVIAKPISEIKIQLTEGKQQREEDMVLGFIANNKNISMNDLAIKCDFIGGTGQPQKSKAFGMCGRLVEEGLLSKRGNKFRITPKGRREIGLGSRDDD